MPAIARSIVELQRRTRAAAERADTLLAAVGDKTESSIPQPARHSRHGEIVRDYFNRRQNHVAELDDAAEAIFRESGFLKVGDAATKLMQRLAERHGVRVIVSGAGSEEVHKQRYDARNKTLHLADFLQPGQQAFQMAVQIAHLEMSDVIGKLITDGGFAAGESSRLARIGLSKIILPVCAGDAYGAFLHSARRTVLRCRAPRQSFRCGL